MDTQPVSSISFREIMVKHTKDNKSNLKEKEKSFEEEKEQILEENTNSDIGSVLASQELMSNLTIMQSSLIAQHLPHNVSSKITQLRNQLNPESNSNENKLKK